MNDAPSVGGIYALFMKKKPCFENFASRVSPRVRAQTGNGSLPFNKSVFVAGLVVVGRRHREAIQGGNHSEALPGCTCNDGLVLAKKCCLLLNK